MLSRICLTEVLHDFWSSPMDQKSCMLKHGCVSILGKAAIKFRGHIQNTRDLVLLRQLLCLLPSSGEQQVHHSSGRTQCSLPAQTDQLYFIRMRADIDRWREKITVPVNRSFGHVSSRSRIENLEPKNQPVSVRLMSAGAKKHTP